MTVAMPIWNSRRIAWLPLEGLSRQVTTKEWELIVMECRAPEEVGYGLFMDYWQRLKKAGCKRLLYIYTGKRLPLGQKWKEIAKRADSDIFLLQAADDYPHPGRVEVTNVEKDWYDTRFFNSYSLSSHKMVLFDRLSCRGWKTGNDMATLTSKVRALPDNEMSRGVDFFLFENCATKRTMDQGSYGGVNTNGANVISMTRERHFKRTYPPFKKAYRTIDELGVPGEIVHRLKTFEKNGSIKVECVMKEKFMHYQPGEVRKFNFMTFNTLQKKGVVEMHKTEYFEKQLS